MDMLQQRAAAVRANPGPPNGASRSQPFKAELRSNPVIVNGQERVELLGCASTTEKRYRMYDMFGEYDEVVDQRAFDGTLSRSPDVAYLVNHRGLTMARTTNDTLKLSVDSKGFQTQAFVNPKRSDVSDLVTAIEDRDITEMSFAFQILDGEWSDDFTEFRILEVELDRGDVSAVNYGANPYTSVAARQTEVMQDFRRLPEGAQREALQQLAERVVSAASAEATAIDDLAESRAAALPVKQPSTLDEARAALNEPTGRSIDLVQRLLDLG